MNLNFISIGSGKFLNIETGLLGEDISDDEGSKCLITTPQGIDLEFTGDDAESLFNEIDLTVRARQTLVAKLTAAEELAEGAPQP